MVRLIETICFEKGEFRLLDYHNERISRSRRDLLNLRNEINIEHYLKPPVHLDCDKVKCRIIYGEEIEEINYIEYSLKPIHSLKMVASDQIGYAYKFEDRSALTDLFQKKGSADDILIIKEGLITDTSYANIVFLYKNEWITPQNPLLKGVRRESYLSSGKIRQAYLRPEDLKEFSQARIINAMISLEESPEIAVENICW